MPKVDPNVFEVLGKLIKPPPPPEPVKNREWFPKLTPAQEELYDAQEKYILCHAEKGPGKCTHPDAQAYTADGLVRMGRLSESKEPGFTALQREIISFDGKTTKRSFSDFYYRESSRNALVGRLSNGADLFGSPRHPIWCCYDGFDGPVFGYLDLTEIKKRIECGEKVSTPLLSHPSFTKTKPVKCAGVEITTGIGYLIGALIGDGSLNKIEDSRRALGFSNTDRECIDLVAHEAANLGAELKKIKGPDFNIQKSRKLRMLLIEMGLNKLCYFKRIPDQIVESPLPVIKQFLSGLFDTDGCVEKGGYISLCTTSEWLGRDVQWILQSIGIVSTRRKKKTASGRPTWAIHIYGANAFRFGKEIGFKIARKQAKITKPTVSVRCPHGFNENYFGYPPQIREVLKSAWKTWTKTNTRSTKWGRKHAKLRSFSSVPSERKVAEITEIIGMPERLRPFLVSNRWVQFTAVDNTECDLVDLSVPETRSFIANGIINHNTYGALTKLVKHCYLNENALALIVVTVRSMANKGGAWSKLQEMVLPAWRDGNRDRDGKLLDEGMGLHYTDVMFDSQHNEMIWIQNQYGGWCMVILVSAPHANQLRLRIRGYEPSFVFVDELTS